MNQGFPQTGRRIASMGCAALAALILPSAAMSQADPIIGQIQYFSYDFCPNGWTLADGRLIDMSNGQNGDFTSLFAIIGQYYGGSGEMSFNLPDARGRMLAHRDLSSSAPERQVGTPFGRTTTEIGQHNTPRHQHQVSGTSAPRNSANLDNATFTRFNQPFLAYSSTAGSTETLSPTTLAPTGTTTLETAQPYLALRACIAIEGRWPVRGYSENADQGLIEHTGQPATATVDTAPRDTGENNAFSRIRRWFGGVESHDSVASVRFWNGLVSGDLLILSGPWCPDGLLEPEGQWLAYQNEDNSLLVVAFGSLYGSRQLEFRLPDLRRRVAIHPDPNHHLRQSAYVGSTTITLTAANLPAHRHDMKASSHLVNDGDGTGAQLAAFPSATHFYSNTPLSDTNRLTMGQNMIQPFFQDQTLATQPIPVEFDSLTVNYCLVQNSLPPVRP